MNTSFIQYRKKKQIKL